MMQGIFTLTFYVPEAPDVILKDLDLQLTAAEQNIYNDIMATETLQRLEAELGAIGNGLVWQKDHFEMIANHSTAACQNLLAHHK